MAEVDVNKVYLVGVQFPRCLKDPSPAKPIPCVVLFLGSTQPQHPQRYVPWQGSPRLPYQTKEVPHISGGTFLTVGYLNFSHALRILVIQENETMRETNPELASVNDLVYRGGGEDEIMHIFLQDGDIDTLRSLHALYWGGARYSFDGSLLQGNGGGGDKERASSSTSSIAHASHFPWAHSSSGATHAHGFIKLGPMQALGSTSAEELFSYKLGEVLRWEEMRSQQVDLLEGKGDFDLADLSHCIIEPPTLEGWNHVGHGVQYDVLAYLEKDLGRSRGCHVVVQFL